MTFTKKNIVRKSPKADESELRNYKTEHREDLILFPEKVERMNKLLGNAILLPDTKNKGK